MIILTEKEKVTLCLHEKTNISQASVAKSLYMSQGSVSRALGKMIEEKEAEEKIGDVRGERKRVRIYSLTEKGKHTAEGIEKTISCEMITVIDLDGKEKVMRLSKINDFLRKEINKAFMITEVLDVIEKERLDINKLIKASITTVDFSSEMPEIRHFYGREDELSLFREYIQQQSRVLSVTGIAGIGKTTLIIKALEEYRGKYNIFWHRFHELSTINSLLRDLSNFLLTMGKHKLRAYIYSREKIEQIDALMVLEREMKHIDVILIFDDCHKIKKELAEFLKEFFCYI